jgi:hypothetical protein
MEQFIAVFVLFVIAILGFTAALHFSKYKRENSACCGGGNCDSKIGKKKGNSASCYHSKITYINEKVLADEN